VEGLAGYGEARENRALGEALANRRLEIEGIVAAAFEEFVEGTGQMGPDGGEVNDEVAVTEA
jgi:hypothetical protein